MYILHKSTLPHTRINLNPHNLNLFYHIWPSNMKVEHLCKFNSLALHKFVKYKTTNKTFQSHFPLELWMYNTPLTWYKQENQGTRLILRPCPDHCSFRVSSHCKLDNKDIARQSYKPVRVHKTHNSALLSSPLSNSICRQKKCAVTKECCMIQSSCY